MKILNKSRWRTDHLRAFIARVAKDELPPEGRKRLRVKIQTRRSRRYKSYCGGFARYGTPEHPGGIRLTLPLPEAGVSKLAFATTIAHELAHSRGATHRQINRSPLYDPRYSNDVSAAHYAWAEALPLEPAGSQAPRKAIPATVAIERKLETCRAKVRQFETKLKRTKTLLAKWQRKVRYYEKNLTKAAAARGQEGSPK